MESQERTNGYSEIYRTEMSWGGRSAVTKQLEQLIIIVKIFLRVLQVFRGHS